jgi:DNA-binding NtrC family response regulator
LTTQVVLVEDDTPLRTVLARELAHAGFEVRSFPSADGVAAACRESPPDVVLLDLKLPGASGLDLLRALRGQDPDVQAVLMTGHGGVQEAVEAIKLGAYDFLVKPTPLDRLQRTLLLARDKRELLLENRRLQRAAAGDAEQIVGTSSVIEDLRRMIARLAPADAPVLIQGENGTGKELIARQLHRQSRRASQPYVALNCAAIPGELVESELFGHERGAFTGADRRRIGLFEAADGGTLLLDEIGELPPPVQPALLRVLQFGEIRTVGSTRTHRVDVRILAATNRDLKEAIATDHFRQDLYYRLSTFRIEVPPLRRRVEDIGLLARMFLGRACERRGRSMVLDRTAIARLEAHDWPGNVRELENAMVRLSVLASGETVDAEEVERIALEPAAPASGGLPTLEIAELERMAIEAALARHGGDKRAAAQTLGISLRTLYNRLREREADR